MTLKTLIMGGVSDVGPQQGIIQSFIQPVVDLMFAAAVFFFIWNVFKLITVSNQPDEVAKYKSQVFWGVVAIVVMASMWGLVAVILSSTGLDTTTPLIIQTGPLPL